MNSDIDEFLDHVDQWKFKLHERLKRMTCVQRKALWNQIHEQARARGRPVVEPEKPSKRPAKRVRPTGETGRLPVVAGFQYRRRGAEDWGLDDWTTSRSTEVRH